MYATSHRQELASLSLFLLFTMALGCGPKTKPADDGHVQESVSETPKEWNAIDDVTIYFWSRSDRPEIPERDYDKQKLIDALRNLVWDGPPNTPPPPLAPYWQVTAKANGKNLFYIYVPDNDHFFVTNGDAFENGRYANPHNCWKEFREELKASKSEFANY